MLVIRADGNAKIGAGHLMRCLSIAKAAQAQGKEDILFVCADEESAKMAEDNGFLARVLHTDYRDMESEFGSAFWGRAGEAWEKLRDDGAGKEKSGKSNYNTILVDSYYVTDAYLRWLGRYGRVFLMDDLQERAFPVDGVINYNVFASREIYDKLYQKLYQRGETGPKPEMNARVKARMEGDANTSPKSDMDAETGIRTEESANVETEAGKASDAGVEGRHPRKAEMYLGGRYVPLREQFQGVDYAVREAVRNVMITTGGGDVDNIAAEILGCVDCPEIIYHVLVGQFSPHFQGWQERAHKSGNVRIYHDVQDMAGLMQECDLAVTAGGSTVYELAAVGVPFICFSYAKNQEALVEYIGRTDTAGSAGAWHRDADLCRKSIRELFLKLCEDRELRRLYYEKERRLVDGRGAERLVKALYAQPEWE